MVTINNAWYGTASRWRLDDFFFISFDCAFYGLVGD